MIKALPLFASVAMVTLSGGSALGLTLVGSELRLTGEIQRTPTSELLAGLKRKLRSNKGIIQAWQSVHVKA